MGESKPALEKIEDSLNKLDVDALRQRIDDAHMSILKKLKTAEDKGKILDESAAFDRTFPNYTTAGKDELVKMIMEYNRRAPQNVLLQTAEKTAGRRRKSRRRKSKKVRRRTLKKTRR